MSTPCTNSLATALAKRELERELRDQGHSRSYAKHKASELVGRGLQIAAGKSLETVRVQTPSYSATKSVSSRSNRGVAPCSGMGVDISTSQQSETGRAHPILKPLIEKSGFFARAWRRLAR